MRIQNIEILLQMEVDSYNSEFEFELLLHKSYYISSSFPICSIGHLLDKFDNMVLSYRSSLRQLKCHCIYLLALLQLNYRRNQFVSYACESFHLELSYPDCYLRIPLQICYKSSMSPIDNLHIWGSSNIFCQ